MLDLKCGAAIAAFGLLGANPALSQEGARPQQSQIVTSGLGEVRVAPDRATVSIGVQTRAATAAEDSAANGRKQRSVIAAIRAKGVAADEITTTGFNVQPELRYDKPGVPPVITGYVVSNIVNVELDRIDLTGAVIDTAIVAGANQIHSLTFGLTKAESSRRAALAIAVGLAKGDAEVVARAAGGTLGVLIELLATEFESPQFRSGGGMAMAAAPAEAAFVSPPPVEPGMQHVRATVTVRWQSVPGGR